jgi:hypothetical protein
VAARPRFELGQEATANAHAPAVRPHDHAQHPGRTIPPFFDVELAETYGAECVTARIKRDPGDGETVAPRFARRGLDPSFRVFGLGRMTPLAPAQLAKGGDHLRIVG